MPFRFILIFSFVAGFNARIIACDSTLCKHDLKISESTKNWVTEARERGLRTMQREVSVNFKKLQLERGRLNDLERIINPEAQIRVFVSSSMPLSVLKTYYKACVKYNGIMVFKGLPQGSFKELYKSVAEITAITAKGAHSSNDGAIQIDDEIFELFGVSSVPTIILSKESDCLFNQSCKRVFDKIEGNIGIKRALEEFAGSGDLKSEARKILKSVSK